MYNFNFGIVGNDARSSDVDVRLNIVCSHFVAFFVFLRLVNLCYVFQFVRFVGLQHTTNMRRFFPVACGVFKVVRIFCKASIAWISS